MLVNLGYSGFVFYYCVFFGSILTYVSEMTLRMIQLITFDVMMFECNCSHEVYCFSIMLTTVPTQN